MKNESTSKSTNPPGKKPAGITPLAVIRFALVILIQPVILFAAAGRIDWWMGWIYLGLATFLSLGGRVLVQRKNPDLLIERSGSLDRADVPPLDKALVIWIAIAGPVVGLLVAGLDHRLGWTPPLPPLLPWITLALATAGILLGIWAMLENRFFSAVVRIQKDRRQTVVSTGPYRFVRHPSYAGGVIGSLCAPFVLTSLWTLIPAGLVIAGYIVRTAIEDRTLLAGLDGYPDYARRVRYRLLPGVW